MIYLFLVFGFFTLFLHVHHVKEQCERRYDKSSILKYSHMQDESKGAHVRAKSPGGRATRVTESSRAAPHTRDARATPAVHAGIWSTAAPTKTDRFSGVPAERC